MVPTPWIHWYQLSPRIQIMPNLPKDRTSKAVKATFPWPPLQPVRLGCHFIQWWCKEKEKEIHEMKLDFVVSKMNLSKWWSILSHMVWHFHHWPIWHILSPANLGFCNCRSPGCAVHKDRDIFPTLSNKNKTSLEIREHQSVPDLKKSHLERHH